MADLNEAMLGTVGNTDGGREFHKRLVLGIKDDNWSMVLDFGMVTTKLWQLVEDLVTCVLVSADGRIPVDSREGCKKKLTCAFNRLVHYCSQIYVCCFPWDQGGIS